jgi:hypothetical protein
MHDIGECAKLLLEAIQIAAGGLAQLLERDLALVLAIERAIHDAGAAGPQRAAHLEPPPSECGHRLADIHRDIDRITAVCRRFSSSAHATANPFPADDRSSDPSRTSFRGQPTSSAH